MLNYKFTLVSNSDTPPNPNLPTGWAVNFYPLTVDSFALLNIHLDQSGGFFTLANGRDGSTGDFWDLTGLFNNFGGFPVSYVVDFDRHVGPSNDGSSNTSHYGLSRGSALILGNQAGFLKGAYPSNFTVNSEQVQTPYTLSITPGTQAYSKSDPNFSIPYGIYNCPGTWAIRDKTYRSVCSVAATYRYSYENTGVLSVKGTQTQSLPDWTNTGYCASMDGSGSVVVFTDTNGVLSTTTEDHGTDFAALAYVAEKFGGSLPSGAQGFLRIDVSQNYVDRLVLTSANDGTFDWATLPQEVQSRVTWAGMNLSSTMRTQALYTITT